MCGRERHTCPRDTFECSSRAWETLAVLFTFDSEHMQTLICDSCSGGCRCISIRAVRPQDVLDVLHARYQKTRVHLAVEWVSHKCTLMLHPGSELSIDWEVIFLRTQDVGHDPRLSISA